jgi:hypothetical protein
MKNSILFCPLALTLFFTSDILVAAAPDDSLAGKFVGKWTQEMIGARTGGAIINITAVDQATGRITGKYIPPSGPAAGKEFEALTIAMSISSMPLGPIESRSISISMWRAACSYDGSRTPAQ